MNNLPIIEISKGYKINYIEKGKGRNLVFIHGWLGSSWVFEAQIEYFSKHYRTIAIDHLGHGKSDKPEYVGTITKEELRSWMQEYMTGWKIPKLIEFIDEVPKNILGKVQRRALQEADPLYKK